MNYNNRAQVMAEFVFSMVIVFLMIYGVIMVFRWVGVDLGERERAHQTVLVAPIDNAYGNCPPGYSDCYGTCCTTGGCALFVCTGSEVAAVSINAGPLSQIDPYFYGATSMNAVWGGR